MLPSTPARPAAQRANAPRSPTRQRALLPNAPARPAAQCASAPRCQTCQRAPLTSTPACPVAQRASAPRCPVRPAAQCASAPRCPTRQRALLPSAQRALLNPKISSRARAGGAGAGGPRTRRREPLSSQQLCKRAVRWGSPGGGAWCATTRGPHESTPAGSAASRRGGSGGGQQRHQRLSETLSSQLREWAVRWGSPGGGAWGTSAGGGEAPRGVEAASLGALDLASTGAEPEEALHTFTLDSGVVARGATILPCPVAPSGLLTGLHLPSFAKNLVATSVLQDQWVTVTQLGGELVAICMDSRTGEHLATFTRRPGSGLYTLTTELSSGTTVLATPPCHACVACSPVSLCLVYPGPCPRSRGRLHRPASLRRGAAARHSSFPPTTAPLRTLHMDVWGPARVTGQGGERYFLLVSTLAYTRYTTVFPLQSKADVRGILIRWIRAVRLQLYARFQQDLLVPRLHSDRGGEFFSHLLEDFCGAEGIVQSYTLPAFPQQNGIAECRIGLVMEVARTSVFHAAAPRFLWPFAVRYAAGQLNLWPRVSHPETFPTLRWTGEVGDASVFRIWGSLSLVRDLPAGKLSPRTLRCVFLGFPTNAPPWQFYHPGSPRVLSSRNVTFDESVYFYRLHPHRSSPVPLLPLSLVDDPPQVAPLPPPGPAPSAEGGDPTPAATVTPRRSARLAVPPRFQPRPSSPPLQPDDVDSGTGAGGPATIRQEALLPEQLREWAVQWGIPGGGASLLRAGGCRRDTLALTSMSCPSALRLHVVLATAHSSVYRPLALSSTFGRVCRAEWSITRACWLPHDHIGHGARAWRTGSSRDLRWGYGCTGAPLADLPADRLGSVVSFVFQPRPSSPPLQPIAVDSGTGAGGPAMIRQEALLLERLREWAVQWGSPGGGASRLRAGGAGTAGVGGTGTAGAGGSASGGTGVARAGCTGARRQETLSPERLREWAVQWRSPGGGASRARSPRAGGIGGAAAVGTAAGSLGGGAGRAGAAGTGGTGAAGGAGGADSRGASPGGAGARVPGTGGTGAAGGAGGSRGASPGGASAGVPGNEGTRAAGGAGGAGTAGEAGGATRGTAGGNGVSDARRQESLLPLQLRKWAVRRGSPGGGAGGTGSGGAVATRARGCGGATTQPQPSALRRLLSLLPAATEFPVPGTTPLLLFPPTDQSQPQLLPGSPLPAPAPHTEVTASLIARCEPETRASTPERRESETRASVPARVCRVRRPRAPAVQCTHDMTLRPSSVPQRVVVPLPPASSLPHVLDLESDLARAASPTVTRLLATVVTYPSFESAAAFALVTDLVDFAALCRFDYTAGLVFYSSYPPSVGGELALGCDVLEDGQFELECLAAAAPHLASKLLCTEGDPDALDIPTPCTYAEAITGPCSSQWQIAMDAEMASWKSKGTYVDEVPPPGTNIVDVMWIFRVKRPPGSPPAFKARYVAQGFSQHEGVDFFQTFSPTPKMTTLRVLLHVAAHRDSELHSLDFSIAFLQGSLHEAIWLRRQRGFTRSFPEGTQWNLRRPVYGLRQAPREWHDTLRTDLGLVPTLPYLLVS
ncbi:unnamed protein product [Closterium sp. NIES-53]